jgi:hypothetical protein
MSFIAAGVGIAGVGLGAYQAISGGVKAHKAQKELERQTNMAPKYGPNKSINDYYQTSLNRYNVDPSNSLQYQMAQKAINNNLAAGISAAQDRRSAGALPRLISASDNQLTNAGVRAEQDRNQRFNELGRATQMKAGDDRMAFNINQEQPYQANYNLTAQKASGANKELSAGISNISNGAQSLAAMSSSGMFNNTDGASKFSRKKTSYGSDGSEYGFNPLRGGYTIE